MLGRGTTQNRVVFRHCTDVQHQEGKERFRLTHKPSQFQNGNGLDHSNPCGTGLPAFAMDKSGEGL